MKFDDINYSAPSPTRLSHLARELYTSRAARGLVAGLQALPMGYHTFGGDDEPTYLFFDAIYREAKSIVAWLTPLMVEYEALIEQRYGSPSHSDTVNTYLNPPDDDTSIGVGHFVSASR